MMISQLSKGMPTRLLFGVGLLALGFAGDAAACAICFQGVVVTPGQKIDAANEAVLAVPSGIEGQFRIVGVVKGDDAVGEVIVQPNLSAGIAGSTMSSDGPTAADKATTPVEEKPLFLLRDNVSETWTKLGSVGADYAGWLQQFADTLHKDGERPRRVWPQLTMTSSYLKNDEWRERMAIVGPQIESPEPLVAEIVYGELMRAPYDVIRLLKPQLDPVKISGWIKDPKLASRRATYTLLLGVAGGPADAQGLEQQIDAALEAKDAANVSAMIAADLELRGPDRVAWVETTYFGDRKRTLPEIQAALLALSVHGGAQGTVPRRKVIDAYLYFIRARNPMAGFVAMELSDWGAWDATADYVAILRSHAVKDPADEFAILSYLKASPLTTAEAALPISADQHE